MKNEGKVVSDKEYEELWTNVDQDRSGDVSISELAHYFGFVVDETGNVSPEMSDDAILDALQVGPLA